MRMNSRQRSIMNLVQAAFVLEEAEEQVEVIASYQNKLKMAEAYAVYRELEAVAIKNISNIDELERCIAMGVMFFQSINSL